MLDIYEVLNIQVSTPDDEAQEAYENKLAEWEIDNPEGIPELKNAYALLTKHNQNWAKKQDDVKRCLANAQKGILKLQKMNQDKTSKEYLEISHKTFMAILMTEKYYLKRFKSFCYKINFRLLDKNEDDFLFYFESKIQKEFVKYIAQFDQEEGNFEQWFNGTMKYRFLDILKDIKEKVRIEDFSLEGMNERSDTGQTAGRGEFGFNFYELLLDVSRLITAMHQHGFYGKQIGEKELDYYGLIFTETVSMVAIDTRDDKYLYVHSEEEVFRTMRKEFLDFYTENICRTIKEISESPLKFYKDLGIDQEGRIEISSSSLIAKRKYKENEYGIKHLKAIVYYAFLKEIDKKCTEGSVSAQLSKYKKSYYQKLSKLKELYDESFQQYASTISAPKNTIGRAD